jgi:hypothetical protein
MNYSPDADFNDQHLYIHHSFVSDAMPPPRAIEYQIPRLYFALLVVDCHYGVPFKDEIHFFIVAMRVIA